MKKHQYIVTLDLSEATLIDRIKSLMSKPQLTDDEQSDFDKTCTQLEDKLEDELVPNMVKLHETSMVHWLPIGGTIAPIDGISYLVSDGITTWEGVWSDDYGYFLGNGIPTHYAEYPVFNQYSNRV